MKDQKHYVCIHCGQRVQELCKKYSNTVKTTQCDKCHQVTDKYIEFEEYIVLIDALLLSQQAFRHMIYNESFKLYWKILLVLMLLESFALCRQEREHGELSITVHEKTFYICSLKNIGDYLLITLLLLFAAVTLKCEQLVDFSRFIITLLKAVAISNLSKFFFLPILVWRNNTTDFSRNLHYILVTTHHICSLILAFEVVSTISKKRRLLTSVMVISSFLLKEYIKHLTALQIIYYF